MPKEIVPNPTPPPPPKGLNIDPLEELQSAEAPAEETSEPLA